MWDMLDQNAKTLNIDSGNFVRSYANPYNPYIEDVDC